MSSGPEILIAVTGGIGSGKSWVSDYWAAFSGIPCINVDRVCAGLLEKGEAGWQAVKSEFGNTFLLDDGGLDRRKMRQKIFSDADLRHKINSLIHPLALANTFTEISHYSTRAVIVDVPLLFEAGWADRFDHRVVVYAGAGLCCRRIVSRDGIDTAEAGRTMLAQMPLHEKIMLADHVINNSGSWMLTILEIRHLARLICGEKQERSA